MKLGELPRADLHAPGELLDNAEVLIGTQNPKMMRAAVLEAITALEAFVQATVFPALATKLDSLLVKWLEDRTRMDFDSRLSVLTPVAIGHKVDKQSRLWNDYKKAKRIRNQVTHSGRRVPAADARFVIDTVYAWLAYLGSTLEVELALIGLKRFIEGNQIRVPDEGTAVSLVRDYFGRTKAAKSLAAPVDASQMLKIVGDMLLEFGPHKVLVDTKFWKGFAKSDGSWVFPRQAIMGMKTPVEQIRQAMDVLGVEQGAVVMFADGELPPGTEAVLKFDDGAIYLVIIQARTGEPGSET
jgi:hypothetical protein